MKAVAKWVWLAIWATCLLIVMPFVVLTNCLEVIGCSKCGWLMYPLGPIAAIAEHAYKRIA